MPATLHEPMKPQSGKAWAARPMPDDGTRQLLRAGLWILLVGGLAALLTAKVFGGIGIHGPHTNSGWLALLLAMMCLPFGAMLTLLGAAKWLRNRRLARGSTNNAQSEVLLCFCLTQTRRNIMAKSVNKVILLGNVGKDPEVKFLPSGLPVANLTLATSDRFKDKAGEWQDRTEWHNLVAFQKTAEIIRDYVKKGSKLYVEGRIQTRSWDDQASGQKKYRTEIIVNDVVLLSGRGEEGGGGGGPRSNTSSFDQRAPAQHEEFAGTEITDDDIPF